jgi:HNH endonuclease
MAPAKSNKQASPIIGSCIYCGEKNGLSDEHIIPYGLGGNQVLKKASCKSCADITSNLEGRLLRGQWRPYRKILGIQSRRNYPNYLPAHLVQLYAPKIPIQVKSDDYPLVIFFDFDIPSVLIGKERPEPPFAKVVGAKIIRPYPSRVLDNGAIRQLRSGEKIEYPMSFESSDVLRLVAKIAHGISIYQNGLDGCIDYFLPKLILGNGDGALTYVGGCSSEYLKPILSGNGLHSTFERISSGYRIINVQFFRDSGDPPPIYEAVVGTVKTQT